MVAAFALAAPVIVGALPEILLALAGIALALILAPLVEPMLANALGSIPILGGNIRNAINQGLVQFHNWLNGWLAGMVWPVIQWVMGVVKMLVAWPAVVTGAIEYTMDQLRLTTNAAAGRFGLVGRQIVSLTGAVNSLTTRIVAAAAAAAAGLSLAQLLRSVTIPQAQAAAEAHAAAYARSQVSAEAAARAEAVTLARAAAAALVSTEIAARKAGDAQVAATAAAAAAAIRAALGELSTHVRTVTDARVGQLEDELTTVRTRTIPDEVARAKSAEAALVQELTIAQQALRCLEPLCSSGYANLLGQLLQGAELLLLLELVREAVQDPEGTAKTVAGAGQGLYDTVQGFLAPFVGHA